MQYHNKAHQCGYQLEILEIPGIKVTTRNIPWP